MSQILVQCSVVSDSFPVQQMYKYMITGSKQVMNCYYSENRFQLRFPIIQVRTNGCAKHNGKYSIYQHFACACEEGDGHC
jgi:hypothetical protein